MGEAEKLQKLLNKKTTKEAPKDAADAYKQSAYKPGATAGERKLIEELLSNWSKKEDVQRYKEAPHSPRERLEAYIKELEQGGDSESKTEIKKIRDHLKRGTPSAYQTTRHGFDDDWKSRTNEALSKLGVEEKDLIKSLMAQFGVDKYRAFEMLGTVRSPMSYKSIYLDNALFKADFLTGPRSRRNFDNSFSRVHVGVNPEETPSFETDEEQREDDEKRSRDRREETTEKSLSLFVSV